MGYYFNISNSEIIILEIERAWLYRYFEYRLWIQTRRLLITNEML